MGSEAGEETVVENSHSRPLYSQQGVLTFHPTAIRTARRLSSRCVRLNTEDNERLHRIKS